MLELEIAILQEKATQGDADAQYNLAIHYAKVEGVEKDLKAAFSWYHKAAEQGFAEAQYTLGRWYEKGMAIEQNHVEAVRWHRKAAKQGHSQAQDKLDSFITHESCPSPKEYRGELDPRRSFSYRKKSSAISIAKPTSTSSSPLSSIPTILAEHCDVREAEKQDPTIRAALAKVFTELYQNPDNRPPYGSSSLCDTRGKTASIHYCESL